MQPADTDTAAIRRRGNNQKPNRVQQSMLNTLKSIAVSEGAVPCLQSHAIMMELFLLQQAGPYKVTDPANFWI